MKKLRNGINQIEFVMGIFCFAYYLACVLKAGPHISILYVWIFMGAALIIKSLLTQKFCQSNRRGLRIFAWFADIFTMFVLLSVIAFCIFVYNGMHDKAPRNCDYVIVLGGGVNGEKPSSALQKRIDCAYEYLSENPNTKVIGTGGKSPEDMISEGECIERELVKLGIEPERIDYEDRSTTTVENFKYGIELVDENAKSIVIVSSGFHISRAKLILSNFTDKEIYGMAADNEGLLTLHYMIREYVVFLVDISRGNYGFVR